MIKLASAEGRTFALGQTVTVPVPDDTHHHRLRGEITGFRRSVDGSLIIAKVRVGKALVRAFLQDIEPTGD
jgi:hypothetical protein